MDNKPLMVSSRALILNKDNQVLLVSHEDKKMWYTPGGRIEQDEALEDCFKREVYEETGLTVTPEKLIYVHEIINPKAKHSHAIAIFFLARTEQNLPDSWTDSGGSVAFCQFFSREELTAVEKVFPAFLRDTFWDDLQNDFKNANLYTSETISV